MSPKSSVLRLLFILVLAAMGGFLLFQSGTLAPETQARQGALAMALAPGGVQSGGSSVVDTSPVTPVVVDLKDIPAGVYDPNNQLARWRRGEIDLNENEGIVNRAEKAARQAEARKLPANSQLESSLAAASASTLAAGVKFDSLDYTECCGGGGNVPPDPELAAGPNHLIAVVNVAFEIYDTSGNSLVGPTTFASFMSGNSDCAGLFDPNALYDESADRFILGVDANGTHYCLAVSQSGDPTGSWNIYSFPTGSRRYFFDYPHAGVGQDAIYMGANIFARNGFFRSQVWAFDKAAMYAGDAASFVSRNLARSEDTPQPLNLHGWNQGTWPSGGPHYFLTESGYNGADYSVFAWSDPFGANSWNQTGTVDLVAATQVDAGMPVNTPQLGGQTLQANDYRPQDFEYRNGYAWSSMAISCNPGGGTVNCVRWAQIDPANAAVVDAGVFASSGDFRTFPDLAVDHCGGMAIGYTKSSSGMYPGIFVTGRESSETAGTLQAELEMKAGEIAYTSFESSAPRRWGDYTEMTIAPDGVTFWYLGEYSKDTGNPNGHWGTHIGSYTFPAPTQCDGDNLPLPTPTPPPPTPEPTGDSLHVGDLDGSSLGAPRNRWEASVTVTIHDVGDGSVSGASVEGVWSNGANGSGSCSPTVNGQCTITKTNIKGNSSSVTFSVTNVTLVGSTYDNSANHDPDGDNSNGTAIIVAKP